MPQTKDVPTPTQPQDQGEGTGPPARSIALGNPTSNAEFRAGDPAPKPPAETRTQVREIQFAPAPPENATAGTGQGAPHAEFRVGEPQFDILLDMSVPVSVVLGQTQIPIRRLLQLGPGSVLQLDKPIETPADLYLKNSKFAEVDVVVVEDRFAVRIQKIVGAAAPVNP